MSHPYYLNFNMEVPMSRLCNKFRLNNPLSHHQQIHSNTFLLQGAKPSANTALVMAYTGLDLSDAVNLKWRNIDFRNQVIRVWRNKTLQNPESREISIPITDRVMDVLRLRNRVRRLHDDKIFNITGYAFQKAWKRALRKSSVDWHIRVKDLRHFFGSYLLNQEGVDPLLVANLMGHSSVDMLLKRYGHFTDETKRRVMSLFDKCTQNVRMNADIKQ